MNPTIGIVGMGYVGLPLAIALSDKYNVKGYDNNVNRINALKVGEDNTKEFDKLALDKVQIQYTADPKQISDCDIYIVTVPTPIKDSNSPDFSYLESASKTIAGLLNKGDIIVYESTVYPGATEEICIPILEESELVFNQDFFVGYSPERINVGDKSNTFKTIPKIVAASNNETLETLSSLYQSVLTAKVYNAPSIKVAEAAKVIENTQRDVNIAFVNELAMVFNHMGLDTNEVLKAAATKWNFLNFRPGLVGGHCIGIDPYYLAHKSKLLGYTPELLLAARKINEKVPSFITNDVIKKLGLHKIDKNHASILLLGATFKENTPDIRNSKAISLAQSFNDKGLDVTVCDPNVEMKETSYDFKMISSLPKKDKFDVLILAVEHNQFIDLNPLSFLSEKGFGYDIKGFFDKHPRIYRL